MRWGLTTAKAGSSWCYSTHPVAVNWNWFSGENSTG